MNKEKLIENEIYNYLKGIGAVVEKMQGGKVLVSKAGYNHMMTLQSKGACDIICYYKGSFIGIEVKKNQKEVDKWKSVRDRYNGIGKTLDGLTSYEREKDQIKYCERILENNGQFLVTWELDEVRYLISLIDKMNAETY